MTAIAGVAFSAAAHVPVMAAEICHQLAPRPDGLYVDATFGAGGYARALLDAAPCRVIGIDRDPDAIARGRGLALSQLTLIEGCFGDMATLVSGVLPGVPVDGVAMDLGVSSPQLDDPSRGFSFRADGPLDMRMGSGGPSAADLVAQLDGVALADIIFRFGEERHSRRIARAIVAARAAVPIRTTLALADIVRRAIPGPPGTIDPATRTFQALRIAVNDELGELGRGLAGAERLLRPGGRLAVVSFHSLEDRIAKEFLRARSGKSAQGSRHLPESSGRVPSLKLVTAKPVRPTPAEVAANPRARSARLRVAERLASAPWPSDPDLLDRGRSGAATARSLPGTGFVPTRGRSRGVGITGPVRSLGAAL